MAQNCPEKCDTLYTQEVVLCQSDFDHPEQLKTLVCVRIMERSSFR